ncbi:hypothetical protein [Robertkochia solimangrovi]|uniref:hypothetical protein n=1 Tax=Robertkochia solimangrovi TaxID=2213046 RepID=UPI0011804641|nr:hypothetical protein [Robertkochia solimangrovi]TRZ43545.1 hypothetical protein DMZ48_08975 [Robertkochia solimangrovi]
MNSTITYVRPVSLLKKIFGGLVFLFALFIMITENPLFGGFMLAFSIYLVGTEGSEIDLDAKRFRKVWSIFNLKFGKWKSFPKFEYVSVFKGKQKQKVNGMGASTSFSDSVFLINLFYERNKYETFYRTFDKQEAFAIAGKIREKLALDILDATERERKWMD